MGSHTTLAWGSPGRCVTLRLEASEAEAPASALFPDLRVPHDGEEPDVVLRPADGGYLIDVPEGSWTARDLPGALTRVELTLAEALVRRSGMEGLHAGGVVLGGRAVLFAGDGGCGKSSLTAGLAARGRPVLGDDVVLVDGQGRVHPFQRLLKVEEPARTLLELPPPGGPLADLWPEAAFYHPRDLGSRWAEPADVGALVLPHRSTEERTPALLERKPAEVLPRLLAGVVLQDRVETSTFQRIAEMLGAARCYELLYAESPAAVSVVADALA